MNAFKGDTLIAKAAQRANNAANYFSKARIQREQFQQYEFLYHHWKRRLITPEALLLTSIFLISFPVEIMVSYEMYREILKNYASNPSPWLVWMMGLFVVGLAAWVSHLISKKISSTLFRLEIFSLVHSGEELLEIEAEERIQQETRLHFWLGLLFFLVLVGLVAAISWQRSFLTAEATGVSADFSLIEKTLPILVVIIEVFTGIYFAYIVKFFHLSWQKNRSHRAFIRLREKGAQETQIAYALINNVQRVNRLIELSKDLRDVLFRVTFLSKSSEHYVDEINIQQCKIVVENHQGPQSNTRVVGLLSCSQLTNSAITNGVGVAFLYWNTPEPLKAIDINGKVFEGPFHTNSIHQFKIDENSLLK